MKRVNLFLPILIVLPFVAISTLLLFPVFHVDQNKNCNIQKCTVINFPSEWSAREYLRKLDTQLVDVAELLADFWTREPWPSYLSQPQHIDSKWVMHVHHITQTEHATGKVVSPKPFTLRYMYELEGGDLLLHGNCLRELRIVDSDEEHIITFRSIVDHFNEHLMGVRAHFLLRISKDGQIRWLRGISAFEPASDGSYVLHVSKAGEVTMVGTCYELPVRFGIGSSTERKFSGGDMSYFVVRFSADGEVAWCGEIGRGWVQFHALAATKDNRVYLLGQGGKDTQFYLDEGKYEVHYGGWFVSEFAFEKE